MRLLFAASFLALVACQPSAPAAPTAEDIAKTSAELTAWFDAEYEEDLLTSPIGLTFQGRKERYGELDQFDEAELDRKLEWMRASAAELKEKFDPAKLDEEARTSYDLWLAQLDYMEKGAKFRRTPYVFVKDGPHVFLPNFVISFHTVADKSDMEAYVSRLTALGRALDQVIESAKLAAAEGNHAPRFAYDQSLQEAKNVIAGAPFAPGVDSPLWADAKSEIATLEKDGKINPEEAKALRDGAEKALKDSVKPAYERIIAWLEADRVNTAELAQGAGTLMKDGEAFYNTSLELQTTTPLTAAEIHDIGLKEVARIHGDMEKIKEQVGFKGTLQEFFTFMRTDKQFYLPNNDAGAQQYVDMATKHIEEMKLALPKYFGRLPKADLIVKRVEPYREEPGGAQHYQSGTPDGSRPGIYYAHLSDMNAMPTYMLEDIAYHEGLPGHHMQISIQQELEAETGPNKLPKFRTQYGYTAYSEGWGLYSEALSKEMGFLKDPYSHYGQLSGEIWRAIRLVVDTGIHSKGWTEEQAVKYFTENSSIADGAIASEVRRYITSAGQATAYKIGMLKLQELRDRARTALGDKFSYPAFHDQILGGGALPLPVLERKIDRWIEAQKAA